MQYALAFKDTLHMEQTKPVKQIWETRTGKNRKRDNMGQNSRKSTGKKKDNMKRRGKRLAHSRKECKRCKKPCVKNNSLKNEMSRLSSETV